MRTLPIISSLMVALALVVIPTFVALAIAPEPGTGIPEILQQPAPAQQDRQEATDDAGQGAWVQQITDSVNMFQITYPASNFTPYLEKLAVVHDAVRHGDRRLVKGQMTAFFTMLARRSHGIDQAPAEELSHLSRIVAPIEEYGIAVPKAVAETHGAMLIP